MIFGGKFANSSIIQIYSENDWNCDGDYSGGKYCLFLCLKRAERRYSESYSSITFLLCIANPGLASIQAALNPADTNYYYYVLVGEKHMFSETLAEHNRNVAAAAAAAAQAGE